MSAWFNYLSFDIMGDLAFGKPFNMLRDGKAHNFLKILRSGQRAIGKFSPTPWLFRILTRLPFTGHAFQEFMGWIREQVESRKTVSLTLTNREEIQTHIIWKMNFEDPDILSYLIEEALKQKKSPKIEQDWLMGDAHLIIVAGR
jgi:hypothetical protein